MAKGKDRDRRRELYWRRIVGQHRGSGLTIRDFCRKSKLPESAFHFWRRELERRQAEQEQHQEVKRTRRSKSRRAPSVPAFVPVRVTEQPAPPAAGRIEIELSGGRRVHLTAPVDRHALDEVLAALEARPC